MPTLSLRFVRTRDFALIRGVFTHPAVWPLITDDFSPRVGDWRPNEDERLLYLAAYDGAELLGVFLFLEQSTVLYEMHIALLPNAAGHRGREAGRGAFAWIFAETACQRIAGAIAATNRLAIAYGKRIGAVEFGLNPRAFRRGGKLVDLVLLGISKGV